MNTIYVIFISIMLVSFILGLFVTFFKSRYNMKLHKYNNSALQKDNYEYAKDYVYNTNEFNFSDKIDDISEENDIELNISKNVNESTIVIPILSDNEEETELLEPMLYSIMDDEII